MMLDSTATARSANEPVASVTDALVVFTLSDRRFGIALSRVERVIRAVEVTPLPNAPAVILGIIHERDDVVPVFDVRHRFGLATHPVSPQDQMLIVRSRDRRVAMLVDGVEGFVAPPTTDVTSLTDGLARVDFVVGVVRLPDGLLLIHDVDGFLSHDEEARLDAAMQDGGA